MNFRQWLARSHVFARRRFDDRSDGRILPGEDFAILLDLQAASAGLELKPENVVVDDGLGSGKRP